MKIALHGVAPSTQKALWIAYEPVWAIGESGIPSTPGYADEMHAFIHKTLATLFEAQVAEKIPVLYGGSVDRSNCVLFAKMPQIDGLFLGRSAWDPSSFVEIINLVTEETAVKRTV